MFFSMNRVKFLFLGMTVLSFMLVGCKDDDKPQPVSYVEDGFYVVGEATAVADLFAENAEKALMAAGLNENADQAVQTGMYEKYVALEGGKSFSLMQKAGTTETQYGATLTKVNLADEEDHSVNEQPTIEIYKGTLTENGTLQVAENGLYHVIVDTELNTVIIAPVEWGVRGAMNGWGFTKFPKPTFNKTTMTYTMTGVTVELSGGFKFAYGGGWKIELNPDGNPLIKANTNLGNDGGNDNDPLTAKLAPGGKNIGIERAIYTITLTWTLDKGAVKDGFAATVVETDQLEPLPEYPDNLYVVGDGTLAGWTPANGAALYPVEQTIGMFYGVAWLGATGNFKFCIQKDWGGDFGKAPVDVDDYAEFGTGSGDGDDNNIPVPGTAGYYVIVVDMANDLISVIDPEIYAIGDAFGSWDAAVAANLFTVNNTADPADATITSPVATAAGNFRAYIKLTWISDWWRGEVCGDNEGGIVFYNDPPDVSLTAGQKVVFNFNAGTSTIE